MLFHLRDAFRAGDVWLARSRRYGDIRRALLSAPAVADADRSLPVPASPHDWLAERRFALDEGLLRLAAAARARAVAGDGSIEDSMLRVERTEAAVPDGAADLVADLYRRMPDARITDILLEVDDATRFTEAFTHLRTGSPCRDRIGLLNVLLAEGINLGLRKMAEATTTHGFWELMRIARWHVEGEAYDRALSMVVEAPAALPMAAFWGTENEAQGTGFTGPHRIQTVRAARQRGIVPCVVELREWQLPFPLRGRPCYATSATKQSGGSSVSVLGTRPSRC